MANYHRAFATRPPVPVSDPSIAAAEPVNAVPAPLWRRLAAGVYDLLALAALWMVAGAVWVGLHAGAAAEPADPGFRALLLLTALGYYGYCWRGGQTLGMRAWRIELRTGSGGRLSWPAAALRLAVAVVGIACFGAGLWWALVDVRGRCWHDLAADTEVLRK